MTNHHCWESVPKVSLLIANDFTKAQTGGESQGFSAPEEVHIGLDLSGTRSLLIRVAEPVLWQGWAPQKIPADIFPEFGI